jgi:peptidoglycan/xylan/chitin deacetylase (PgdA/CDA1 family)
MSGAAAILTHTMNNAQEERRTRKSAFSRFGTYLPLLTVLGLGIPALIYLTLMQTLGWQVPTFGMNGLIPVSASGSQSMALYAPQTTKEYFSRIGGNYETLVTPWRHYFANRKTSFKELRDATQIRDLKEGVLILPSAVALNDEERKEISSFQSRGGAILATWATGARNGKGDWEGWQFLEALGARVVGEIPSTAELGYLVLNGESPVTHTHPAGYRFGMSKTSEPLLRLKGEKTAARFMNWARVDSEKRDEGAIIFTETKPDAGRAVVFAFSESVWESRPFMMYSVIDDSIQWLQRTPAFVRAVWPNGKHAAQVIEMDTEDGFPNALVFAAMMKEIDFPATFYVLTSAGRRFPEVLSRLEREFELGYHGDVHDSFKGQPAKLQEQRMQIMRTELATVVSDTSKITGFRAPTEGYDATTEQLLQKTGIRHHAADPNRTDARLPLVAKLDGVKPEDALIVLPRTQRDDINLANHNLNVEQTTQALISDFDLLVENGGLGFLSVHTQNFYPDGVLAKAMPAFLERVKQRREQVWLASAGQVAQWWRARERFKLSTSKIGKRLEIDVTVTGKTPLSGPAVIVMLPQKGTLPQVLPMKIGLPRPSVSLIDEYRAAIFFDSLEPGDYVYQVNFSTGS